ncbi:methyltransferase domain-containing protein [Dissoconium aciculare CBS 342.82]|uniref:phosphoethanolamine N-methyltransferase n=1 Tax=Dissoconium aciculare CBS 342.82 TaxID=1314786 RepID=A0A6J3M0A0_9PEZI|nr:methyltransferase domain-containing protein [Dissoconium aciculare CBS 342.82]KAF1821348.1 methyltransferase domain-containing protein [Dissoconium aciculare CBS 342.82]
MATVTSGETQEKPHESKQIVRQAYNSIAGWYLNWITGQKSPREEYTQMLLDELQGISKQVELATSSDDGQLKVLELGAGAGVPVTQMLIAAGVHVLANDISSTQLNLARERCPTAEFFPGDMMRLDFPSGSLDGVASFYAIFHLPRAEQTEMMKRIARWLRVGGVLVMNLATEDAEEIHGEFMGWGMFWSGFAVEGSLGMVESAGLTVVKSEVREAGEGLLEEDDPDYGVKFLWIVARKDMEVGEVVAD